MKSLRTGEGVTIVGCGALGTLVAVRLAQSGVHVQVLQRRGEQFDALSRDGAALREADGRTSRARLVAVSDSAVALAPVALAIVLVKSYSTHALRVLDALLTPGGRILTLQNGLGNAEILVERVGAERVLAGIVTYGAYRIAPGLAGYGGDGEIVFGPWLDGVDARRAADLLNGAGLKTTCVADPRPALWRKLVVNAMVNPVGALTGLKNGELLEDPGARKHMAALGREAVAAAHHAGVPLDFDDISRSLVASLERTAANTCSMLQDVRAGRPTEIEAISGRVLAHAPDNTAFPYTREVYRLLAMNRRMHAQNGSVIADQ